MNIAVRSRSATGSVRTTLAVAPDLVDLLDRWVANGRFSSRNSAVDLALRRLAWDLDEEDMFEAFAEAAEDPEWVAEAKALASEGDAAAWEVVQLGDAQDDRQ